MRKIALISIVLFQGTILFSKNLSEYQFTDQNSKPFTMNHFKGHYTLISFVYSHCPVHDMCPKTMTLNKGLLSQIKKQKEKIPLRLLIVTLDPKRDTPETLKKYADTYQLDPELTTLVTGQSEELSKFSSEFNVVGIPSGKSISHNIKSVLLDPHLKDVSQYKENEWNADLVLKDVLNHLKESNSKKNS